MPIPIVPRAELLKKIPERPGIYLMLDEHERIVYIGGATNLKKRVTSYFAKDIADQKTKRLLTHVHFLDYEIHESDEKAFLRERELIRIHHPKYNIEWRDDKEYPMIRITKPSSTELFSRLFVVREVSGSHDWHFGRKTDVKALRRSIRSLRRLFPIANKGYCFNVKKPCLDYSVKRCVAPCANKISLERYQSIVGQLVLFLQGKRQDLMETLYKEMEDASKSLEFERAATLRDRIAQIERTIDSQHGFPQSRNRDVFLVLEESNHFMLVIYWIKDDSVLNSEVRYLGQLEHLTGSEILQSFVRHYYMNSEFIPPNVEVNFDLTDNKEVLELWLSKKQGTTVHIKNADLSFPSQLKSLISEKKLLLGEEIRRGIRTEVQQDTALHQLMDYLGLDDLPTRIECFDISTTQGTLPVGSMVVYQSGTLDKSQYRKFKIKSITGEANDVAMLAEMIERRLKHTDLGFARALPDLIVVDGGKPQVNTIARILKKQKHQIPVIGLAKKEEDVFLPHQPNPVPIPKKSPALLLLQQIRDEAHRFAITYHQKRRLVHPRSQLDLIPGVGAKRRNALLQYFGDLPQIKKATVEELAQVEGINRALAERIYLFFRATISVE
ncbi:MAG: excinuclease ABC subunit UvrC [Candidatus Thorarchaeota archaeon]